MPSCTGATRTRVGPTRELTQSRRRHPPTHTHPKTAYVLFQTAPQTLWTLYQRPSRTLLAASVPSQTRTRSDRTLNLQQRRLSRGTWTLPQTKGLNEHIARIATGRLRTWERLTSMLKAHRTRPGAAQRSDVVRGTRGETPSCGTSQHTRRATMPAALVSRTGSKSFSRGKTI